MQLFRTYQASLLSYFPNLVKKGSLATFRGDFDQYPDNF